MALSSSSSKHLLKQYHRLAEDTLLGGKVRNDAMVLEAAEDGRLDKLTSLLDIDPDCVNARCPSSGDTPLIIAARAGDTGVLKLLLKCGADVTMQNDLEETALDVASADIKKMILDSIQHEDRAMSNTQALLQSAWLGDAVSLKKHLESGRNYLDVNCQNTDGLTPVLLVTRDINLFEQLQNAMETNYDPISTMQDLIRNNANLNSCDRRGRSPLHQVASSTSVHAKKMASVLLRNGTSADTLDDDGCSPLHVASGCGHTAIIVALVEEGGADINVRGRDDGTTPLIMSAREGHDDAARYLLSHGADVTALDNSGKDALSVATSPSMVGILKEAWVEQTKSDHSSSSMSSRSHSPTPLSEDDALSPGGVGSSSLSSPLHQQATPPILLDQLQNMLLEEPHPSPHPPDPSELFFVTEGKLTPYSQADEDDTGSSASSSHKDETFSVGSPPSDSYIESDEVDGHLPSETERRTPYEVDGHTPSEVEGHTPSEIGGHTPSEIIPRRKVDDKFGRNLTKGRGFKSDQSKGIANKKVPEKSAKLQTTTKKSSKRSKVQKSESEGQLNLSTREKKKNSKRHLSLSDNSHNAPSQQGPRSRQVTGRRPAGLGPKLERILSRSSEFLLDGKTSNKPAAKVGGGAGSSLSASDLTESKDKISLPPVTAGNQAVKMAPPTTRSMSNQRLPALANMQPVAFLAVDTEKENLKLHRFPSGRARNDVLTMGVAKLGGGGMASPKSARHMEKVKHSPSMQRSFSLNIRDTQGQLVERSYGNHESKKRNSVGSVAVTSVRQQQESKVPLLPKVVTPQFGMGVVGGRVGVASMERVGISPTRQQFTATNAPSGRGKILGMPSNKISSPVAPPLNVSIEEEDTLTGSSHQLGTDSTLKDVKYFDTDSLDTTTPRPGLSSSPSHSTNLMVSHAKLTPSSTESPIWKPRLIFQDDTDTASSNFISSPIGELDTFPSILLPGNRPGVDGNRHGNHRGWTDSVGHSRNGSEAEVGGTHSRQGSEVESRERHSSQSSGQHSRQGSDASWHSLQTAAGRNSRRGSDAGWNSKGAGWQSRRGSDADHAHHGGDRHERSQSEDSSSGEEGRDGFLMWKKGKLLGKGAYGKVWEGLLSSAQLVAVKEVELDISNLEKARSQYSKIQAEVGILRSLSHKNIVRYLGTSMQEATVYIFMQYISGGSIQSMVKRFGSLSYDTIVHYTRQTASALDYLHGNGIIHRDIKGANIMVDPKGTIKLIDFGCAKNCVDSFAMHSVRGTPYWMAPEVIRGEGYGKKSDIWSLGCTVQEMATTKPPWGDCLPEAALFQIGVGKPIPKLPNHLDKDLTNFIYFCLTRNQMERPDAAAVLNHNFLN